MKTLSAFKVLLFVDCVSVSELREYIPFADGFDSTPEMGRINAVLDNQEELPVDYNGDIIFPETLERIGDHLVVYYIGLLPPSLGNRARRWGKMILRLTSRDGEEERMFGPYFAIASTVA